MFHSLRQLRGCKLGAIDGDLGRVVDVYFDDQAWAVRYLVVDTHRWWPGQQVLISPTSLGELDDASHSLPVSLTQDQVRHSPDVSTHLPVSRQRENELAAYYGWPMYWVPDSMDTPILTAPSGAPGGVATQTASAVRQVSPEDVFLRSAREAIGYHIHARDGTIGHLEDFLVDDAEWMIRYLIADTRNFWPGKSVLISPLSVRNLDWAEAEVVVDMTRQSIESAPIYDPHEPVSREYEDRLHEHHGWVRYWL